nr:F-box/WD repeat-containing protein 7 [Drosophila suzukii]XP_036670531.1 F-box/WD repeat-containing protein 7 [Drosophila suzukii]
MERGCPAASSESVASAGERTQSAVTSSTSTWAKSQASTSRKAGASEGLGAALGAVGSAGSPEAGGEAFVSMSTLRDDVEDVCVSSNSQHGFAVVLDDESSTFEISSSNSLPTSAGAASTVGVVAVDDSSSTDTLNGGHPGLGHTASSEHSRQGFFNEDNEDPPVVCLINDDDDDEEPEPEDEFEEELIEDDDEDVVDIVVAAIDCPNTSQLALADGTIMAADGSKIFLETPVVEEAQPHPGQVVTTGPQSELTGKPKRLSDEFLLGEEEQAENLALGRSIKSEPVSAGLDDNPSEGDDAATCSSLHDRLMSVRLKQMSLTANAVSNPSPAASANAAAPEEASTSSSSSNSSSALSKADIESMDLIERRDFETEQRLTGGIILRTSSMMSQNKLNLSLIKSVAGGSRMANGSGAANSDDWPSSSNGRTVSSDSKYTYNKDLSTTPTSSRKYTNSRLSKSTAKLNLGSTLGASSCSQHRNSSSSTSKSTESSTSCTGAARTDVYTNTNSNDYPGLAPSASGSSTSSGSCQQDQEENASASVSYSSVGSQTSQEGGCSRTTAINPTADCSAGTACLGDSQASTSASTSSGAGASNSNRCQYATASTTKAARQVNASAQTQERFLARSNLSVASGAGVAGAQPAASVRQRRNGSSDVVHLEVVVEEGAAGGDGGLVEPGDFSAEEPWGNCDEENNCSDLEEICTCQNGNGSSYGGSNASLSETFDLDVMDPDEPISLSLSTAASAVGFSECSLTNPSSLISQQRKRKYNEGRLLDGGDYSLTISSSGGVGGPGSGVSDNCRKRIAYDFASTPRSSQHSGPTAVLSLTPSLHLATASPGSALGRRTPRSVPTRDNPPPELQHWLGQFQRWSHVERLLALDRLIDHCDPSQVRHMMKVIEPQFQRDFISLLPRELALFVLSYLEPKDLLRAAQTCRSWRFLCDDNLLWKEKCRKAQILAEPRSDRPKRGRDGNMPPIASPWKAAYMRQHIIEMNWRSRPVRKPKVLKGHDDHVITCLQFSGNRIVSGSDDNTLKVWSAVNGKCLRTLVGHTGGVWSSQMSGNIIISGSTDRTLKVWDMDSGACVHTLQGHTSTVRCMHLHGSKVVSGSRDATLRVWDIEQGSCLHVLVGHLAAVRCVQYDGKLIVSGAYDYMVKIWHPERQECLHTLQGHTNRVYSLQFDGLHVVSGSLDTSIRVWDVETGNCKHTLMGHQSLTSGMELRQNILVSGNADSTVKVWDITTGQCLQTLSGPNKHQSAVTCLQFNSRFVVTSSDDGTVKLWDVKTGDFIRNLVALDSGGSGGVVWRIRANDTKLICAVGSRNGTEETKLMVLDFDVEGACVKCS